jgi:hypothetical protein
VAVGDADEVAGKGEEGAAADVKADVEFGYLDDAFFTGHAIAYEVERVELELGELLDQKTLLHPYLNS